MVRCVVVSEGRKLVDRGVGSFPCLCRSKGLRWCDRDEMA